MTIVTKNPTAWSNNTGVWTNPAYALGVHDGLCASKGTSVPGLYTFQVKTFGFNIPAGSTINSVTLGFHSARGHSYYPTYGSLFITITKGGISVSVTEGFSDWLVNCASALDSEQSIPLGVMPFSAEDLNNETFTVTLNLSVSIGSGTQNGYVDCCWITVDYTEAVGIASKRLLVGVGL